MAFKLWLSPYYVGKRDFGCKGRITFHFGQKELTMYMYYF